MANTPQSIKRARQAQKRRQRNQTERTLFRTVVKRARAAAESGDGKSAYTQMQSVVDRAARKNLFHHRTVARIKKRINNLIHAKADAATAQKTATADTAN